MTASAVYYSRDVNGGILRQLTEAADFSADTAWLTATTCMYELS